MEAHSFPGLGDSCCPFRLISKSFKHGCLREQYLSPGNDSLMEAFQVLRHLLGKTSFDGEGMAPSAASEVTLPERPFLLLLSSRGVTDSSPQYSGRQASLTVDARKGKPPAGGTVGCSQIRASGWCAPLLLCSRAQCCCLPGVHGALACLASEGRELGAWVCPAPPLCSWRLGCPLSSGWVWLWGEQAGDEGERSQRVGLAPCHLATGWLRAPGCITALQGPPLQVQGTASFSVPSGYFHSCWQCQVPVPPPSAGLSTPCAQLCELVPFRSSPQLPIWVSRVPGTQEGHQLRRQSMAEGVKCPAPPRPSCPPG